VTITEVRDIKERISLETVNLKGKDLHDYYASKAKEMQDRINKPRNPEYVRDSVPVATSVN